MKKLENKVAFITGSARGNGKAIATVMAEEGAIVILADILDDVYKSEEELLSKGCRAKAYKLDITKKQNVNEVVENVINKFGKIDILVNNAGIARLSHFLDITDEIRDLHYNVNVVGSWNCAKAIVPYMVKENYGRIINISSVTGPKVVDIGMIGYSTSKAAIIGFTKNLAIDLANYNITANAILPGYILTEMVKFSAKESNPENPQAVLDGISSGVPLGRFGQPKEIGYLAAFLASDEAAYITGQECIIDGGAMLPETNSMGTK